MANWGTLCQCRASPGWVDGDLCGPSLCLLELGGVLGCVQAAGLESRLDISLLAQLLWG